MESMAHPEIDVKHNLMNSNVHYALSWLLCDTAHYPEYRLPCEVGSVLAKHTLFLSARAIRTSVTAHAVCKQARST